MKAKILLLFSCLILSVGVFASEQTQELDLTTFTTYGTCNYDNPASKTFTANRWSGIHKNYGTSSPLTHDGYSQLILELPSMQPQKVLLKVEYTDDSSYKIEIPTTSTIGVLELDDKPVKNIIINNYSGVDNVTIVLDRLYLRSNTRKAIPVEIYSGTNDHVNWKNNLSFGNTYFADVEAGSKIRIDYTLGSDEEVQYTTSYQYKFCFNTTNATLESYDAYRDGDIIKLPNDIATHYIFTLNADDAANLKTYGFYMGGYNVKTTKVTLINYYDTYATEKVLESGSVDMAWSDQWNQPADVISSLQAGDVMKITASGRNYDATEGSGRQWPQVHISWNGTGEGKSVSQGYWSISEFPHVWSHTLTADEVTAIKATNNLALRGNNVTVTKWTLTQTNVMSRDDETSTTANNVIWEGPQTIDWNNSGYVQIAGSTLTSLAEGQELRFYYTGTGETRRAGAQWRWGENNVTYFIDGTDKDWLHLEMGNNCFTYTLTSEMITNIQSDKLLVTGIGIKLTKIEVYTPSQETTISNDITLSGENIVLNDVSVSTSGTLTVANTVECYDFSINAANGASAQVINPNNLTVNGNVYFDLQLDPSGTVNTNQWYAFSVPFQADVAAIMGKKNGAYVALVEGLENEYLVLSYDGTGWAQMHEGNLTPGNLYMIGLNPSVNDLRFVKAASDPIQGETSISLNAGWNALGNTQVRHVDASAEGLSYVQVYNSASDNYTTCALNATSFVVGSAFFAQAESDGTLTLGDASHSVLSTIPSGA